MKFGKLRGKLIPGTPINLITDGENQESTYVESIDKVDESYDKCEVKDSGVGVSVHEESKKPMLTVELMAKKKKKKHKKDKSTNDEEFEKAINNIKNTLKEDDE